ncbi:MAG TPA: hypothetical protein VKE40_21995, partial [Gemmataceae bacterium]|nr:hypothetical protein [Gemmataceae bacterium]
MSAPTAQHDYVGDRPAPKTTPRARPSLIYQAVRTLASLKLTVVLFSLAMVLVFFGTLGMTQDSIEGTVHRYFRSWIAMIDLQGLAEFCKVFLGFGPDFQLPVKLP